MRRLSLALALSLGLALASGGAARADVPGNVATYGSSVYATGVHVIVYTDA
jgi:hypothetical protein